ncbi:MAG: GumC family protein [Sphingobium sp.]
MATAMNMDLPTEPAQRHEPAPREHLTDFVDLGAVWLAFRRRIWLFFIVFVIIVAIAPVIYLLQERIYAAQAEVVVTTSHEQVTTSEAVVQPDKTDNYAVETEVQVLQSPALARRVVEKLRLWANPHYVATDSVKAITREQATAMATSKLQSELTVKRSGLAFVIDVIYQSPDPRLAANVANSLVEEYTQNQLDVKLDATRRASSFLNSRLAGLKAKAEVADAALAQFRAAHPMLTSGSDQTIVQSEMSAINGELAQAQAELAERRGALDAARKGVAAGANALVGSSGSRNTITDLRRQETEMASRVADLESRYGDKYPELIAARSQLDTIRSQIKAETARNISELRAQVQAGEQRVASIAGSRSQTAGTLVNNNEAKAQLEALQREALTAGATYEQYLQRFRDTSSQEGSQNADARILALAEIPSVPVKPSLPLYLGAALIAGLLGGTTAVVGRELLEKGVRTTAHVRAALGMRTLAVIPEFRSLLTAEEKLDYASGITPNYIAERPFSAFTESFRMLHAALHRPGSVNVQQVVAVTSALPGEGKSTCAACLVRVAAMSGQRAVLVECDTRRIGRSEVARESEVGLLEVLSGSATVEQALRRDEATGAYILPLSRHPLSTSDVLTTTALDDLLARLRRMFQFIVMDTAPVLPIAETRLLVSKADAVAYLVRWGATPRAASAAGVRIIEEAGTRIAGAVLTQVDLKQQHKWTRSEASSYYSQYKNYYR